MWQTFFRIVEMSNSLDQNHTLCRSHRIPNIIPSVIIMTDNRLGLFTILKKFLGFKSVSWAYPTKKDSAGLVLSTGIKVE